MPANHLELVFRACPAHRHPLQLVLVASMSGMLIGTAIGPLRPVLTLLLFQTVVRPTLLSSLAAKPIMPANHPELVFRACPAHRHHLQLVLVASMSGMLIGITIGPLRPVLTLLLFQTAVRPSLLSSLAAKPIMPANHPELVFRACPAHRHHLQLEPTVRSIQYGLQGDSAWATVITAPLDSRVGWRLTILKQNVAMSGSPISKEISVWEELLLLDH